MNVARIEEILLAMRNNPKGIRFAALRKACDHFLGAFRQSGSSHRVYKTPWTGDPRVNIQEEKGTAKAYQVRQIPRAIEKIQSHENL